MGVSAPRRIEKIDFPKSRSWSGPGAALASPRRDLSIRAFALLCNGMGAVMDAFITCQINPYRTSLLHFRKGTRAHPRSPPRPETGAPKDKRGRGVALWKAEGRRVPQSVSSVGRRSGSPRTAAETGDPRIVLTQRGGGRWEGRDPVGAHPP